MKIGFIGLGIMGSRMAANLIANGFDVTVHNRTKSKADDLIAQNAQWADSPAALAANADCVITMLAHPAAVEAVAPDLFGAMREGAIWMDCSTTNPAFARRMASEASARGVHFLDAPVAGSKNQAQNADLIFIIGGDDAIVEKCKPLFDVMGKAVNHVGENSMGIALKIVVNHMLATSMLAFAEGMALGESLGIPQERLLNTLIGSAVAPAFLGGKRAKIESGDYEPEFPLRWMQKDLEMATESAYQTGAAMPLANAAKEIYQLATRLGYGDKDFSAIYAFLATNRDES